MIEEIDKIEGIEKIGTIEGVDEIAPSFLIPRCLIPIFLLRIWYWYNIDAVLRTVSCIVVV